MKNMCSNLVARLVGIAAVLAFLCGSSFAAEEVKEKASFNLKGRVRVDSNQDTVSTKVGDADSEKKSSSKLNLHTFEVNFFGNLGPVDYTAKLIYNNKTENLYTSKGSEYEPIVLKSAWFNHNVSKFFSIYGGKIETKAGALENELSFYHPMDMYITSAGYGYMPQPAAGIGANLNFGDHQVNIQIFQGESTPVMAKRVLGKATSSDKAVSAESSAGGLSNAIQYKGNINNMISPILSVTMLRPGQRKFTSGNQTYQMATDYGMIIGVGAQLRTAGVTFDVEYDWFNYPKYKINDEDQKAETLTSLVVHGKYDLKDPAISPFVKFTLDNAKKNKDENIGNWDQTQYGLGVEYWATKQLRYHAMYSAANLKERTAVDSDTKKDTTSYLLGAALTL